GASAAGVDKALAQALAAVQEVESATDRGNGPLATLDAAAGGEAQKVPPALLQPLVRALAFCRWSDGTHGPLGALLWDAWGRRAPAARRTPRTSTSAAVARRRGSSPRAPSPTWRSTRRAWPAPPSPSATAAAR